MDSEQMRTPNRAPESRVKELRSRFPEDLAVVYRHYPLDRHRHARSAAYAVECAAAQGKLLEMTDLLFALQDSVGLIGWTDLAKRAGIADSSAHVACMRNETTIQRVVMDEALGRQLGVRGTPTVLVNQWRVREPPTLTLLVALVERELAALDERGQPDRVR